MLCKFTRMPHKSEMESSDWRISGAVSKSRWPPSNTQPLDWNASLVNIHFRKLPWCTAPGHAGVKGNDRTDRLAGKASLTSSSLLGRSEVLRSSRHYLRAQSQGHHTIDRLEERGVERGSARRSSSKGRERAIVHQTNIGTVSKATLWKLLRGGVERARAFPNAHIPSQGFKVLLSFS